MPWQNTVGCWCGLILIGLAAMVGCASPGGGGCNGLVLTAPGETVGAISPELFAELPLAEQNHRIRQAQKFRATALSSPKLETKLSLLTKAVATDPDFATGWLDLAGILRWAGEDAQTENALINGERAITNLAAAGQGALADKLIFRDAILRAWYHYDRGEWLQGRRWARTAMGREPGSSESRLITGLLSARLGEASQARNIADDIRRLDEFATEPAWISACLEASRGLNREAFSFYLELRPQDIYVAECYRDMARTAEQLGEWSYARRWYRESASAAISGIANCLTKVVHSRLAPGSAGTTMPVWLGIDESYATGSWSAYTALAMEKFNQASPGPDRDRWAGAVINGAGICLRMNLDRPWARRAKGLVFAATDHPDKARSSLRKASRELAQAGTPDALVEGELGRMLILEGGFDEALLHLQRAVSLDPNRARSWSDLGLVLVRTGKRVRAGEALTRAIELDPGLAVAWYNRGLLAMHMGNLEQAAADLKQAVILAPDNQEILHLLQRVEVARQKK